MSPAAMLRRSYKPQLNDVNKEEDLQAANRVKRKHINVHTQKMKVSPAAQTLSKSLGKALCMLEDVGYTQFKGSSPTVEFILFFKMVNTSTFHYCVNYVYVMYILVCILLVG